MNFSFRYKGYYVELTLYNGLWVTKSKDVGYLKADTKKGIKNLINKEISEYKNVGKIKNKPMATKKKAVKKTAARFVKGSKAAKDFMAKLRAKRSEGKYQYGKTNKVKDKRIQAKKAGKRVAKKSKKVYYEYRANRSDIDQRTKNKGGTLLGINYSLDKRGRLV